ncbi:ubiquinol-cytochrome c reductase complex protein [Grosmannia clavigera kw1407]|uniref:Cytochrome b-c1 complex subunit 7 n=1 Tax=Grosmannia clavigera (strain kw1407 / UAMH 11150) TaxID=655863 RepID=F0XM63_GROCL|nr:ubiquinol-cytochrome c reductase complex protein [Grosmannia clavigera kw1407]EFX01533.1 ubiquinol-cytochrome c reductase complex protein [Grosmannia clavigera kw1407]
MSYISAAPFIRKRPWLLNALKPLANWYINLAGYRQMGLRSDDLIPEESAVVQQAIGRLSAQVKYDRVFRMRRATQLSLQHKLLPKAQWTKPEEDTPYLLPIIKQVEAEIKEQHELDSIVVIKSQ